MLSSHQPNRIAVPTTVRLNSGKNTEFSKLASEATASFIDAQKKFVDIAGKQMNANLKTAGRAREFLRTFPIPFVGTTAKPPVEHRRKPDLRRKRPARRRKKAA